MPSLTTVPFLVRGAMITLVVIIVAGLLSGPGAIRHEPQSAEAALLSEVQKLTASDAQATDFFGQSVAVSGDTAVVGANGEDAGGSNAGAAYVFGTPPVGGIAEVPEVAGAPLEAEGSSGPSAGMLAGFVAAVAAGAAVLGGAASYARRRGSR